MSFISSFYIISVVVPEPKLFSCIPGSAADATALDPIGIKTHLANSLIRWWTKKSTKKSSWLYHLR